MNDASNDGARLTVIKRRGRKRRELARVTNRTAEEIAFRPLKQRLKFDLATLHDRGVSFGEIARAASMRPEKLSRYRHDLVTNMGVDDLTALETLLRIYVDPATGILIRDPWTGERVTDRPQRVTNQHVVGRGTI